MIIVRLWEGLGNQLFQYAYARALVSRGHDVRLDIDKSFDDCFDSFHYHAVRKNRICEYNISVGIADRGDIELFDFIPTLDYLPDERNQYDERGFFEELSLDYKELLYDIADNTYLKGWFQSEKYFKEIRTELIREITLKKEICLSAKLKDLFCNTNAVAIHVRRGDYVRINHALNKYYYIKAINKVLALIDNPIFVVFTDNENWVKRNLEFGCETHFVSEFGKFHDYEELIIMSKFKNIIISNSTFSWWAAWINQHKDKQIWAPNSKSWMKGQENIVPSDWNIV